MSTLELDREAAAELIRRPADLAVLVASLLEPGDERRTARIAERMGVDPRTVRRANKRLRKRGWGFRAKSGRPRKKRTPRARVNRRRNPDPRIRTNPPTPPHVLAKDHKPSPSIPDARARARRDELAPPLVDELGEGGIKAVQTVRKVWPEASPSTAADAVRRAVRAGATPQEAADYFAGGAQMPHLESAKLPWLAACANWRLQPWLRKRRRVAREYAADEAADRAAPKPASGAAPPAAALAFASEAARRRLRSA